MDQSVAGVSPFNEREGDRAASLKIFYVNPLDAGRLEAWPALAARAADMGFTHLMTAPIFDGPSIMLPRDFDHAHPCFGGPSDATTVIKRLADIARSAGLRLLLDVVPDQVAADGGIAATRPDLFKSADERSGLNPQLYGATPGAAAAQFVHNSDELTEWWREHFATWRDAGVAGFRLTSLVSIPRSFVRELADRKLGSLLGWTPGLGREALDDLVGSGLDGVFSSLPWWDHHSDWIFAERKLLRRVAPVIACVEAPFDTRAAAGVHDPKIALQTLTRAAGFAASFGDGWMMPDGFERGVRRAMSPRHGQHYDRASAATVDAANAIKSANGNVSGGECRPMAAQADGVVAFLRSDCDPRYAAQAALTVMNTGLARRATVQIGPLLEGVGGRFAASETGSAFVLQPGEVRTLNLHSLPPIVLTRPPLASMAATAAAGARVAIEAVAPSVENGEFPAKRGAGELAAVSCDLLCDGHDKLSGVVRWREADSADWVEVRLKAIGNDRWGAAIPLGRVGRHEFLIEAWRDVFASYSDELSKKHAAGVDVRLELMEGRKLVAEADAAIGQGLETLEPAEQVRVLLSVETATLMAKADQRAGAARSRVFAIDADRLAARFASWYEIFPRSMSDDPTRHGTFRDVIRHLPRIRDMGFDVLYFPPIHPIGVTNRKGKNNALKAAEGDVGSPYAIGGTEGGHDALHPDLGTFQDFQDLRAAAEANGLELALDFAIQCSPDHPWLKEHHDWFAWRPDGSMKYAENPPKKYEDIVNVDFYAAASIPSLWVALCDVVLFWAEQGVRIIRVDNPHTKPFPFWAWMISEVRARYPDVLFLAEAFTRPKIMNRLGKIGFSQSYTYFTWRNSKAELQAYLTELTEGDAPDFFRPNFFVNTPDINPPFLQTTGRAGHLIRAALAATLSGLWGVYSGFELCEATPLPGREEYLDSEKYQIRAWDWERPGNIVAEITALNQARRVNPALQTHLGVSFLATDNDRVMVYEKATPDRSNVVLVCVSLDVAADQTVNIELPFWKFDLPDNAVLAADDLMTGREIIWTGKWQAITLYPSTPFAIWRLRKTS